MGMFDYVRCVCPKCGEGAIEFQSKAGECELNSYSTLAVPPEIAKSLIYDKERCPKCDAVVRIKLADPINTVRMIPYVED